MYQRRKIMKKVYSLLMMLSLVFIPGLLSDENIDVSGDWEMSMETPRGTFTRNIHFEQDGEKLIVTMEGGRWNQGEEIKGEGTIVGNKVEWTIKRSGPMGEFKITYAGTVEGDTMSGEVKMGNRGSRAWKAKRKT
jgi:hypothetical protein